MSGVPQYYVLCDQNGNFTETGRARKEGGGRVYLHRREAAEGESNLMKTLTCLHRKNMIHGSTVKKKWRAEGAALFTEREIGIEEIFGN